MRKSVEILKQFLETEYIHNQEMDSPDMETAVRDCLTDLAYICKEEEVEIGQKVQDALSVYYTETGCYRSADSVSYGDIEAEDVQSVAKRILGKELTEDEIDKVLEEYPHAQEQDPTGSWDQVVEFIFGYIFED